MADDFLAEERLADFLAEERLAVDFLAEERFALDFLAEERLAVDFLALDRLADDFLALLFFAVAIVTSPELEWSARAIPRWIAERTAAPERRATASAPPYEANADVGPASDA
ncbi:MAG: hypothetical protein ACJ79S_09370 [Gemmatimonadaceae bacterium]